jgi:hypothetical protein
MRVVDLSDISNGNLSEEGYFDSYPEHNNSGYIGAWSIYPFFDSGNIVISDRTAGFILIKPAENLAVNESLYTEISLIPNPVSNRVHIVSEKINISSIVLTDVLGTILQSERDINSNEFFIDIPHLTKGMYFLRINNQITKKVLKD